MFVDGFFVASRYDDLAYSVAVAALWFVFVEKLCVVIVNTDSAKQLEKYNNNTCDRG